MQSVKVKREVLLERIRANRDAHRAIFEDALIGYRRLAVEELEQSLAEAKSGRRIQRSLTLVEPQDHTEEYDRVIDMLENSVDEEIVLDAGSYAQFMRDDWAWKRQFLASNSHYTAMAAE